MHPPLPLLLLLSSFPLLTFAATSTSALNSNITTAMSNKGCKSFTDLLLSTADAASTFDSNIPSGLTIFCPSDQAISSFLPTFKNLSADSKLSLLLFHAVPVYYSVSMLQSNNGAMNTLATDGATKNFNFTVQNDGQTITLGTAACPSNARIVSTVYDRDTVAVYKIDQVLRPVELFKPVEPPAPAPAPKEETADAPASAKGKKNKKKRALAPASDSPEKQPDDQKAADDNSGHRGLVGLALPVMMGFAGVFVMMG